MNIRRNWSREKSGQGMPSTCRSIGKSRNDVRRRQGPSRSGDRGQYWLSIKQESITSHGTSLEDKTSRDRGQDLEYQFQRGNMKRNTYV